jgi:hypothetical protein
MKRRLLVAFALFRFNVCCDIYGLEGLPACRFGDRAASANSLCSHSYNRQNSRDFGSVVTWLSGRLSSWLHRLLEYLQYARRALIILDHL